MVAGSLAFDRIMSYQDRFKNHILPEKIHILNVSFLIKSLENSFGGTAGNIAYNLALLGEAPVILGVAGADFVEYQKRLKRFGIDGSLVKIDQKSQTANAFIITDLDDNQITAYYPGPKMSGYFKNLPKIKADLAIVSPDDKDRMMGAAKSFSKNKTPYIFDPGQQLSNFSKADLKNILKDSLALVGNDYEIELVLNKLEINLKELQKKVKILIITKGSQGSLIYNLGKKYEIKAAKPLKVLDPTGAGDAYRAGFMKGLLSGLNLEQSGRLASVTAVYAVEKQGTQKHSFTMAEVRKRYRENYGEGLEI